MAFEPSKHVNGRMWPPANRAIGFGWPLFLIALPAICAEILTWRLAALHVLAAWTPLLINSLFAPAPGVWGQEWGQGLFDAYSFARGSSAPIVSGLSFAVGAAANVAAYKIIRLALSQMQQSDAPEAVSRIGSE